MKKLSLATVATTIVLLLMMAPQVSALELEVTPDGTILFYEDGVLGESTDSVSVSQVKAIKSFPSSSGRDVRIERDRAGVNVQAIKDTTTPVRLPSDSAPSSFTDSEQINARRIKAQFPAGKTDQQIDAYREDRMERKEDAKSGVNEELQQKREEYLNRLQEERKERFQEKIELRSDEVGNSETELEIETRDVRATLRGADFQFDPENNEVKVITPSGQEKVLNHLPDQAVERLKASVTIRSNNEVEVETSEDGSVFYKAPGIKEKRVFGLFRRNVNTEVVLNDETGEITERELPSRGILGEFLDSISL